MSEKTPAKKTMVLALLLVIAVGGKWYYSRSGPSDVAPSGDAATTEISHMSATASLPTQSAAAPPAPTRSEVPSESRLKAVSAAEYRKEVARDPESPPPATVRFATELGHRMEEAMSSQPAAEKLMPELEDCTLARGAGHDPIVSIQALCLSAARKLGKRFPESLGGTADQLLAASNPRVAKLLMILPESQR